MYRQYYHSSSTMANQFSCCMHRLKQSRLGQHSPRPQPGTLATALGRDDLVDVSHRPVLSARSDWQLMYRNIRTFVAANIYIYI